MKKVFLFIHFCLILNVAISQTAEIVLDKYFEAVGTREQWKQLESRIDKYETSRARIIPNEFSAEINYNKVILYKVAKRREQTTLVRYISVDENSPHDTTTSSFNGADYWFQFKDGKISRPISDLKEVALNSTLGHPDLLLKIESFSLIGTKNIDDKICYIIRLTINNNEFDYYFDSVTNYLIMYHPKDKGLKTKLSDYRNIHGLMIPFREEISNEFGVVSLNKLTDIELNRIINDNYFNKTVGDGLIVK